MTLVASTRGDLLGIVAVIAGRLIQAVLIVYSIRLLTSLIDPDELGRYYLFISLLAFPGFVLISPVGQFFARKVNSWHQNGLLLSRLYEFTVFVVISAMLTSVALWVMLEMGFFNSLNRLAFVFVFALSVLFQNLSNLIPSIFNLLFYRVLFSLLTVLAAFLMVVVPYYLAVNSRLSIDWLWGGVVAYGAVSLVGVLLLTRRVTHSGFAASTLDFSRDQIHILLRFSVPLALATLFMWFQSAGLRVLVEHYFKLEYLAFLGVGLLISQQISMLVESVLSQIYHPFFFSQIEIGGPDKRARTLSSILEITVPLYLVMLIFILIFAREIFVILVDEQYRSAYCFLQIAVFFDFFRMLSNQYAMVFQSELNTRRYALPYVVGALFTVIAVMIGLYFDSLYYYLVPIVWSFGMFVTFLIIQKSAKTLLKVRFPRELTLKTLVLSMPLWAILNFSTPVDTEILMILLEMGGAALYCLLISYVLLKDRFIDLLQR